MNDGQKSDNIDQHLTVNIAGRRHEFSAWIELCPVPNRAVRILALDIVNSFLSDMLAILSDFSAEKLSNQMLL